MTIDNSAVTNNQRHIGKTILAFAIIAVVLVKCFGKSDEATIAQRYPGPWMEAANIPLAQTLAKNGIKGCGEWKYRRAAGDATEYLLYCTRDGHNWLAYTVFTGAGAVTGPSQIPPDLPP